jgi:hypothetical protein
MLKVVRIACRDFWDLAKRRFSVYAEGTSRRTGR